MSKRNPEEVVSSPEEAERLTLEISRRLRKPLVAPIEGNADPDAAAAEGPSDEAIDELMSRYDRSRPRASPIDGSGGEGGDETGGG